MDEPEWSDFDHYVVSNVACVWCNDNNVLTVTSNWKETLPTQNVIRYSQKFKQKVEFRTIRLHNQNMGGVDLLDGLLASYHVVLQL